MIQRRITHAQRFDAVAAHLRRNEQAQNVDDPQSVLGGEHPHESEHFFRNDGVIVEKFDNRFQLRRVVIRRFAHADDVPLDRTRSERHEHAPSQFRTLDRNVIETAVYAAIGDIDNDVSNHATDPVSAPLSRS